MKLLEGVELSRLCDYSFVEESAQWGNIFTPFMKPKEVNLMNGEFLNVMGLRSRSKGII